MIRALAVRFGSKTARERRALRVGSAALGVWLLANLAVRPYWDGLTDLRERLARERGLLARETTLLAESRGFAIRFSAIERTTLDEAPRLFPGSDLLAASAALAGYAGGQAAVHRVMIQQSEGRLAENTGSGTVALGLDIKAVSDLRGIAGFLYALEHGPKLVRVEQLLITALAPRSPAEEPALALVASLRAYALADSVTEEGARQ